MLVLSQAPVSSSSRCCSCCTSSTSSSLSTSFKFSHSNPKITFFSKRNLKSSSIKNTKRFPLILSKSSDSSSVTKQSSPPPFPNNETVFVDQESVPLEGVIQIDKPTSSPRIKKWGRIALLAGGDVLALLMFAAIGRFSHGFPVFDTETARTADPFIAGWFLSAYFLGGFSEDGRGMNGSNKAVFAAAKSWALGIPVGLGIRALTSAHFPPTNFILVTLGSTAVLLIGWRTLLFQILPGNMNKKDDMYKRGSPFELFELLTSLVRRW
ncbi:Histone-lysine N-methyltransferase EZ1 [Bienertia sinuspersici]